MRVSLSLIFVLWGVSAWSSGYDKPVMWSGHYAGIAGAATSTVTGSESIYFNPAGLADSKKDNDVSFNISPTLINFKAPNAVDNRQDTTHQGFAMVPGLTYQRKLNEKLGLGVGYYASAGTDIQYDSVVYPGYTLAPTVRAQLQFSEVSIGAGYKIDDHWKVGLAWRGLMVNADWASASDIGALVALDLRGLKGSNWTGYRTGVQYTDDNWGAGLVYRSAMPFAATGTTSGNYDIKAGTSFPITGGNVEADSIFPQEAALGLNYKISDAFKSFLEYEWTNYSAVDQIVYKGSFSAGPLGTNAISNASTYWSNQNVFRLAGEYNTGDMPIRFGYVYTSQVTPEDYSRTTFSPAGAWHTLTLGTGCSAMHALTVDGALEYDFSQASVASGKVPKAGSYQASVTAVHVGASYAF